MTTTVPTTEQVRRLLEVVAYDRSVGRDYLESPVRLDDIQALCEAWLESQKRMRMAQGHIDAAFETLTHDDGGTLRPLSEVLGDDVSFAAEALVHASEQLALLRTAMLFHGREGEK